MEPQVQYAKTSDGVDIAFCETGQREPVQVWAVTGE